MFDAEYQRFGKLSVLIVSLVGTNSHKMCYWNSSDFGFVFVCHSSSRISCHAAAAYSCRWSANFSWYWWWLMCRDYCLLQCWASGSGSYMAYGWQAPTTWSSAFFALGFASVWGLFTRAVLWHWCCISSFCPCCLSGRLKCTELISACQWFF